MAKIKTDPRNYRKHSDRNKALIRKSLEENGAGRSIVVDNKNFSIGGSGVYEQAEKLGIPVKIIDSDGSELIVVRRTDISPEDPKRKQLALTDNATSDSSEFDFELLGEDFDNDELSDWGIEIVETFTPTEYQGIAVKDRREEFLNQTIRQITLFYNEADHREFLELVSGDASEIILNLLRDARTAGNL